MPRMGLQNHLRNTFLTGAFAAIPIAATVFVIYWVEKTARGLLEPLGIRTPFVAVLIALVAIYLLGLVVNSLIGRWLIGLVDRILSRVPGLRYLYEAWKHISITPGGKEGIFAKVVLVPDETGRMRMLGFSSGEPIAGDPRTTCVFVPASPNPVSGRLYFVRMSDCQVLSDPPEEAFKMLLSTGNYIPPAVAVATSSSPSPSSASVATVATGGTSPVAS